MPSKGGVVYVCCNMTLTGILREWLKIEIFWVSRFRKRKDDDDVDEREVEFLM